MSCPNILWIVTDHQLQATRPTGVNSPLQNKLAAMGVEFTRAYSVLPVCSPARASMLTGLYPHAHGLTENDGRFGGRAGIDQSDWLINQMFLNQGYRCGWFGKWHVSNELSAQDFGFEGFSMPGYGYPYSSDRYLDYLTRKRLDPPVVTIQLPGESGLSTGTEVQLTECSNWFEYESGVATFNGSVFAHEAYFVSDLAGQWIRSQATQPFFVRVDTWGPHPPYMLGEPFWQGLRSRDIKLPESFYNQLDHRPAHHRTYRDYWQHTLDFTPEQWAAFYRHALEHALQIENALFSLLEIIDWDNTIVIFTSDHGDAVGSNGGTANKGGLMTEATMRIPLIMAGPGIAKGVSCQELVSQLDLLPTLFDLCDVPSPDKVHGLSLAPLLQQRSTLNRPGLMVEHYGLHEPLIQRAWYQDQWKLVLQQDGFSELYDLSKDPAEQNNLAELPGSRQKN